MPLVVGQCLNRIAHREAVSAQRLIGVRWIGSSGSALLTGGQNAAPPLSFPAFINGDAPHDGEGPAVESRAGVELGSRGKRSFDGLLNKVLRVRILGPQNFRKSAQARKKLHKPRLKFVQARSSSIGMKRLGSSVSSMAYLKGINFAASGMGTMV